MWTPLLNHDKGKRLPRKKKHGKALDKKLKALFISSFWQCSFLIVWYSSLLFLIVVSDATRNLQPTQSSTSHHPPGAVSYNVTLHQHQAPPGAHDGKAGDHRMAAARGREQGQKSDKRNQVNNNSTRGNSSSKFPYKVYEMSGKGDQSEFAFREFNRLDILLNLSLIHRKRALDISRYLIDIGKTTMETGLRMVQVHSGNKTQTGDLKRTVKIGRRLISAGKKILARGEKVLKAVLHPTSEKPLKERNKPSIPDTRISDLQVVTPVIKMISLCSHGPSYYGVTLLGGIGLQEALSTDLQHLRNWSHN